MTTRETLFENYENALFSLLMMEVAEAEGKLYLEEIDELNQNPGMEISEELDRRCRRIIRKECMRSKRRKALRITRKALNKVVIIAFISMLLFTTAYTLIPEVRVGTLNMLIEVSNIATSLTFGGDAGTTTSQLSDSVIFGYRIPVAPDGFIVTEKGSDSLFSWITYENGEGAIISIDIGGSLTSVHNVDTEDADSVEQLTIHGYEGLLIEKRNKVHIVWGDTDQGKFVDVICINVDKDTAIEIAKSLRP